jgi:hypothetical protein
MELGINPCHVARQLSLESLIELVNKRIAEIPRLSCLSESVEFVCSKKRLGSESRKFSEEQQNRLIDRLRGETGVYVDVVDIPGSSEKGVDQTISGKIEEYAASVEAVVLVSADRDFIPTLSRLRHKVKVILVALNKDYPIELRNEGYSTLFLRDDYPGLFEYHYPRFYLEDLNTEKCAELFSEADDRIPNQLRGTHDGYIYISTKVALEDLHNVKFRWETLMPYNGYVGPHAASDVRYVKHELDEIQKAWRYDARGLIDLPVEGKRTRST